MPDLAALYDLHAGAVYAFALNLLRDEGEAKDILHNVFVRLARSAGSPPARPGLLKLTHWLVLDRLRQKKSQRLPGNPLEFGIPTALHSFCRS